MYTAPPPASSSYNNIAPVGSEDSGAAAAADPASYAARAAARGVGLPFLQCSLCLFPKDKGVLLASQLRTITLLNTDYKLLTKVFVGRLMGVLPSVLQKSQLCSVRGRNIMQGAISLLSTAEFVQQRKRRGLMLNLDV